MIDLLSGNIQDYLKHIYALTEDGGTASTTELAERLGIAPASVTGMIQRLANAIPPLVAYRKHQGVTLTPEGRRAALEVIRHHRLLETYLVTMLGYSWDTVHDEACRLEHVISEEFEARIAAALGHPSRDPHGEPIPDESLEMPAEASLPLSALRPPQRAVILRVQASDPALLRHLEYLGLVPGAEVEAIEYSPFDQNLTLTVASISGLRHVVGVAVSSRVYVTLREET
ncbi:MAG: metal-dependent transcriptional regulator [Anaerolineales bacterium]|nr:metal-dependent transcriptional regulator [Anaerolineales bacterium]